VLADVYDHRDGGLPILGAVAWSVRQMVKRDAALKAGVDFAEAAKRAGVAPFKAKDVAQVLRQIPPGTMERWLALLAETDLALKGSKRPANAVLEAMVVAMCR
jgi:DNA polymerase-3 subunit delta